MVEMYGGTVGMNFESSGDHGAGLDNMQPLSGWWVYETKGGIRKKPDEEIKDEDLPKQQLVLESRRRVWEDMEVEYY